MKFNLFGRNIEINVKNRDNTSKIIKTEHKLKDNFMFRSILIVFVFLVFSVMAVYRQSINSNYTLGSILKADVIAYRSFSYTEDILDNAIRDKIINNTTPAYDRDDTIAKGEIKEFSDFLQQLSTVNLKSDKDIYEFIKKEGISANATDIRKMGIKGDVKYYIFLVDTLSMIYDDGIASKQDLDNILTKHQIILEDFEKNILKNFIKPNLKVNEEKTRKKIEENIQALKNNTITVNKGDIIARKGEKITPSVYKQLARLGMVKGYDKTIRTSFTVFFLLVISYIFIALGKNIFGKGINSKGYYPTVITFVFVNLLYLVLEVKTPLMLFLVPFTTVAIIANMLTKDKGFAVAVSTFTAIILAPNLTWFLSMIIISLVAISNSIKMTNRVKLVRNGFILGAIQGIFVIFYGIMYNYDIKYITVALTFSLISGFLTGMICLGILPYFENTFKILTEIKLLELGDYSSSLLKRLLLEAPGTFYHSIMVGALAEQAAEAIGANPTLARVGAYYHDIGKLKRPVYFVENQGGLGNLHDDLKPSLSALLLTSHPRDGYIIGKSYGLPEEILNVIIEHHGTTMVQYFYYKAVEIGEHVSETDFRYVGPKPSTKESAIVMLADTVEAAIRASRDKSREGIESTIRYLIKYKIDDNQLTNCDINLRDIDKIVDAFLTVLKAAYHERIQYPSINARK